MVIAANGAVSSTGGMATSYTIAQTGTGIGPGSFTVTGDASRAFHVTWPATITIRNGARALRISALTQNTTGGTASLNASGNFTLTIGGTLTVGANPTVGNYSGTYNVTVTYQ